MSRKQRLHSEMNVAFAFFGVLLGMLNFPFWDKNMPKV